MLKPSDVKPFLVHPEVVIREFAANYFAKSFCRDPDLMPIILNNCLMNDECSQLSFAVGFLQSQETLTEILKRIARQDANLNHYVKLVRHIEPRLLERNFSAIRKYSLLKEDVAQKIKLLGLSTDELWDKLLDFAKSNQDKYVHEFDFASGEEMVKELGARSDVPILEMRQRLQLDPDGSYEEIFMSTLAGELHDEASIPFLIEKMSINGDLICETAVDALVKIGTESVVELVLKRYLVDKGYFRRNAASLFGQIKLAVVEEVLLKLLPMEEDMDNATVLADSLCQLLSKEGIHMVQQLIQEGYASFLVSLEESLYVNCMINGVKIPELSDYQTQILE